MKNCSAGLLFCFGQSKSPIRQLAILSMALATCATLLTGCGGSGGGTHPTPVSPPSNLTYPQAIITATSGQAISADTPTVTGTVNTYSVSPALPSGLTLNTSTGAITGTPTTATAQSTYTVTGANAAGSTTATVQITINAAVAPPTNLSYPQSTISATMNQAITTDTPTVTGTVTTYSVNPALPAGLSLNASSGAITGTPTAVTAQATYTITAANSGGSITATVQIVVSAPLPPPTSLSYPQTVIVTSVGQTVPADIPTVTGIVANYSSVPTLPAGLNFNVAGAISGTPTAAAPQATYTVTATNSGGSTTATVTITVNKALPILLDVGHAGQIDTLRVSSTRVLSQDTNNHWVLWDNTSTPTKQIISGGQVVPPYTSPGLPTSWPVDMAGQIFVVGQTNGFDVRAIADGSIVFQIEASQVDAAQGGTWWKLATDGTYICAGSQAGLVAWDPAGNPIASLQGNYSAATVYAAPGQIFIANSPAGQNVIQTVSFTAQTVSNGPTFSGTFNSWFTDGQNFFTNTGNTVYTYSSATSTQSSPPLSLPTVENLTGQGNWFWTYSASTSPYPLTIYPINSSTASIIYNLGAGTVVVPSANTIGVLPLGTPSASVISLAGSSPIKTDHTLPIAYEKAYASTPAAAQWIVGNRNGVVLDGTTATTTPRYFGTGQAWSIAGGTNYAAVATASGQIFLYMPATATTAITPTIPVETINFASSAVALSSNTPAVLAAMADTADNQYETDRTLNIYNVPSGTLSYSIPSQYTYPASGTSLFGFSLASGGTALGQVLGTYNSGTSQWTYTRQVAANTNSAPVTWSDNPPDSTEPITLSPDGLHIAVSSGPYGPISTANLYNSTSNTLVASRPGFAVGWISDNQLLVNTYTAGTPPVYSSADIYSATGNLSSGTTLPNLLTFQPISSSSIYAPSLNQVLSVPTGAATYSSTTPLTGAAAIAGANVVFATGTLVVVDTP
jgi:hypothetical protein